MKLKKKAILFLEGMLNKKEGDEFLDKIRNRIDIQHFMKEYEWIDSRLKIYFNQKEKVKDGGQRDSDLNQMVNQDILKYHKYYSSGDYEDEEMFLAKLKHITSSPEKKSGKSIGLILNIAASIVFMAIIIAAVTNLVKHNRAEKHNLRLFTEYFTPYEDKLVLDFDSDYIIKNNHSLNFSEKGEFLDKQNLTPLLRSDRMNPEDILLISIILIQENELELAKSHLSDILEKSNDSITESARWYLALVFLRQGNLDKSSQNLEILCKENTSYTSKSCKLLGIINKKNPY